MTTSALWAGIYYSEKQWIPMSGSGKRSSLNVHEGRREYFCTLETVWWCFYKVGGQGEEVIPPPGYYAQSEDSSQKVLDLGDHVDLIYIVGWNCQIRKIGWRKYGWNTGFSRLVLPAPLDRTPRLQRLWIGRISSGAAAPRICHAPRWVKSRSFSAKWPVDA